MSKSMIHINSANIVPCKPEITSYIIARDRSGSPCVYALRVWDGSKTIWIVAYRTSTPYSYMFRDTGEFGYTEDQADMFKNGFEHVDEAIEHFHKFYGPAK